MEFSNLNNDRQKRRKPSLDLGNMVFGKVPPQAKELEEAILGACLIEATAFDRASEILKHVCFYGEAHQRIFKAMTTLSLKNAPIDLLTVVEELKVKEELDLVGGPFYISKLTNAVVSAANIESHSRIVLQKFIQREIIRISGEAIGDAYEDAIDVFDLLDRTGNDIDNINQELEESNVIDTKTISFKAAQKFFGKIEEAKQQMLLPAEQRVDNRILSYLKEWDMYNGELYPYVYTIAARPAMGKTAFIIEMICRMAQKFPVGFISGEMTNEQICNRIICNSQNLSNEVLKKKAEEITTEEQKKYNAGLQFFEQLLLQVDDSTTDIAKIRIKARSWVRKHKIKVLFIDFLQILSVSEEKAKYMTETQFLNHILEVIRRMSKELKIPIILLSQLNRELYRRGGNKEPNLADLKGSGKIEEISYQISFLHRPEYYLQDEHQTEKASDKDAVVVTDAFGEDLKGLCYLIVKKHREGRIGRIKFKFEGEFSRFSDWEDVWAPGLELPFDGPFSSDTDGVPQDLPF